MKSEKETITLTLEQAFKANAIKKESWLYEEVVKGLKEVGVKVWLDEEPPSLIYPFKTILCIDNENGKRYRGALKQKITIEKE